MICVLVVFLFPATQDAAQHRPRIEPGAPIAGTGGDVQGEAAALIDPTHPYMFAAVADSGDEAVPLKQGHGIVHELGGAVHGAPPACSFTSDVGSAK